MSIDREFTFLNQSKNSSNNSNDTEFSINRWNTKPSKVVNFVKNSSLKYLISVLLLTWWTDLSKTNSKKINYDMSGDYLKVMEENDIKYDINNSSTMFSKYSDTDLTHLDKDPLIVVNGEKSNKNCISSITFDEEFSWAPWIHILQTTKEKLFLAMNQKLSSEDYQDMFKWLKDLQQWAIGNCYFVVALKNLARSKYFDTLIMSSIERVGKDCFNVYMPLWEPWWIKVTVSPKDLAASTVRWSIWYKILQIWFAKYLLFKKKIIPNTNVIMTDDLIKKTEKWNSWEAMQTFLWPRNFKNKRIENNPKNKSEILDSLQKFNPNDLCIISVSSKAEPDKVDQDYFKVGENTLYYGHAYLISSIEKEWNEIKYITLDNPRNNEEKEWWTEVKLTLSEFFEAISAIHVGNITEKFLDLNTSSHDVKIVDSVKRE